jgi:hypothetical protein
MGGNISVRRNWMCMKLVRMCECEYLSRGMCTYMVRMCECEYLSRCMCTYMNMYADIYACLSIYVYVYINIYVKDINSVYARNIYM